MKKFYCVISKFFDSGHVRAMITIVLAEKKPENQMVENKFCDEYHDYFDTYQEAKLYQHDCENA